MTARDFVYWLQGLFELSPGTTALDAHQTDLVKRHLAMVFVHDIDPAAGGPAQQEMLNKIHEKPESERVEAARRRLAATVPGGTVYRC